jgi:hypothetical protein
VRGDTEGFNPDAEDFAPGERHVPIVAGHISQVRDIGHSASVRATE